MAMTMEQHRQLGAVNFNNHMSYAPPGPQFTNPWTATTTAASSAHLFPASLGSSSSGFETLAKQQVARMNNVSMPYPSMPNNTATMAASGGYASGTYGQHEVLNMSHDLLAPSRSTYDHGYSSAPSPSLNAYSPASTTSYLGGYGNISQPAQHDMSRRLSQQPSSAASQTQAAYEALDASPGMAAMSQDLTTPRNVFGPRSERGESEAYGFPPSHSSHSSISSSSPYPYYDSSVDASSVSDYSSQSESVEPVNPRTLPRPSGLTGALQVPAPQSMMGQFNSKISSSTQKKHKCKVCDKRFTRPSSLQTHMYSHTGEKPYACEADGCGRHFSVVSNLRRHRKVHKGDPLSDRESPERSWVTDR